MKRSTVTLCMIARNEEATIGMTIKSVLALVDEIIVVDTGSDDNTRIIAEGYGARVIDLPWRNDFSLARNGGLADANGDWILVLDADEYLQPIRPVEFQHLLCERHVAGYRLRVVGSRADGEPRGSKQVRLFRNATEVRYQYPIHEQVLPSLQEWSARQRMIVTDSPLTITHEGHCPEKRALKRDRNLRILSSAVATFPDEPYFAYQLARENLVFLDSDVLPVAGLHNAVALLESAWQKVTAMPLARCRSLPYGNDLAATLTAALLTADKAELALQAVATAREHCGEHADLLLQAVAARTYALRERAYQLTTAQKSRLLRAAHDDIHVLRHGGAERRTSAEDDHRSELLPLRYLAELALLEGRVSEAAELFEKALTVVDDYSFAWLGLAECARFAGDKKRALKLYLRAVTANEWNHRAWLRGCSLLVELEFRDNADSWRRKVAQQFPEHPSLAAETLSGPARDDDAEEFDSADCVEV